MYSLKDFDKQDVKTARAFLKKAFLGWVTITCDEKIDEWMMALATKQFSSTDNFSFTLRMDVTASAFMAAVGVAKNERVEFGNV